MEVLILTIFVSLALVVAELLFFAWNVHHGSHDHVERLPLLPLEHDDANPAQELRPRHATHREGDQEGND